MVSSIRLVKVEQQVGIVDGCRLDTGIKSSGSDVENE